MLIFGKNTNTIDYGYLIEKCLPSVDVGWGCMHRSVIMMLKLILEKTGRGKHKFNIYDIVQTSGAERGKLSSPSQACQSLVKILSKYGLPTILAPEPSKSNHIYPCIFIVNTRLSNNETLGSQGKILIDLLSIQYSVGAIGGKPRKAMYILGVNHDDRIIALDPHINALKTQIIPSQQIDPSLVLAYLVKSPAEHAALIGACSSITGHPSFLLDSLKGVQNNIELFEREENGWIINDFI